MARKRKRIMAEMWINKIHECILNSDGIITRKEIAKQLYISSPSIARYMREVLERFDDIEAINGKGYRRKE